MYTLKHSNLVDTLYAQTPLWGYTICTFEYQFSDAPEGRPTITMTESRLYEGETMTLKCESFVQGNPRNYTYRWKKDGNILTNVGDNTKDTLIFAMSQTDEGRYSCVANNDYGETEESAPAKLSFLAGTRPPPGM